jgi:hypothetical protein
MIYERHDFDTANMIAATDTEGEALATVTGYVAAHGRTAVETWVLLRASADGTRKESVAAGDALADRALHAPAHGETDDQPPIHPEVIVLQPATSDSTA